MKVIQATLNNLNLSLKTFKEKNHTNICTNIINYQEYRYTILNKKNYSS